MQLLLCHCGKPSVYEHPSRSSICAACFAALGDDQELSAKYAMSRQALALIAQGAASAIEPPLRGRVVVVVTDESGAFVGVGTSTGREDTEAILQAACFGADKRWELVPPAWKAKG